MKMRVETVKDSLGRLRTVRVFKGRQRRGVEVDFVYDDFGVLKSFEFEGRRENMPTLPELIALINTEFIERIGTVKRIDEITEIKEVGNIDTHSRLRGEEFFNDRLAWAAMTDSTVKMNLLKQMYRGRGGFKTSWWDSEVAKPSAEWTPPPTETGVCTLESAPWNNAIHLRNSKDGKNVDMIYFAPQVKPAQAWMMRFDMLCPTLATLGVGASDIVMGFEIPSQGGTTLADLTIGGVKVALIGRFATKTGMSVVESADISAWVATGTWKDYYLIWIPPRLTLIGDIGGAADTISIEIPNVTFYPMVTPFFANEDPDPVVEGVYIGQIAAWHIVTPKSQTPMVYNKTMTLADTEYSQALPSNTKKFLVHSRDGTAFRLAFETGKVAAPTSPYFSIPTGVPYWEDHVNPSSLTLYVACAEAAKIVEIIAWS